MNFDFYRTFYYVGKYRSITAAARALYVTQPSVTHAIQSLERELGCPLFIRSQKGVRFTPEGEKFYASVAAALRAPQPSGKVTFDRSPVAALLGILRGDHIPCNVQI